MRVVRKSGAVVAVLLTGLFVVTGPNPAHACSCAAPPSVSAALEESAAVFAGTVVATRTVGEEMSGELVARVAVEEVFGGDVPEVVEVTTAANSGLCGLGFRAGDRWLLYADQRDDGSLTAHDCTRSAALAYADEEWVTSGSAERDLEQLGTGRAPPAGEHLRSEPGPAGFILGVGVLAIVGLAVTLLLVRRYARRAAD